MSLEDADLEYKEGRKRKNWTFIRYKVKDIWEVNSGANRAKSFPFRREIGIKCNIGQKWIIKKLEPFIFNTPIREENAYQ